MPNLLRRTSDYKWYPDADAEGAPDGVLLRADNTVAGIAGARSLRKGCTTLSSGLGSTGRVHTLLTPTINGEVYRFAGIDNRIYRALPADNAFTDLGTEFDGSGDMAFGDDSYQAFFARGTTKMKFTKDEYSQEHWNNWNIAAPRTAPTCTAATTLTATIANLKGSNSTTSDETDGNDFTLHEGTWAFVNNYSGTAYGAMSLKPVMGTGIASASKKWASDQNFKDIEDVTGAETDLFDIRAAMANPGRVKKITVMFGLGTGTDPFVDDYYVFDWNINQNQDVAMKDVATASTATYGTINSKLLGVLDPQEVTALKSPEQAAAIIKRIGSSVGSTSTARNDTQQSSPAWGHLSVTRGQFKRVGNTSGRDWSTVRGFKVIYTAIPNTTDLIYLSDAIYAGGGERALTGTYKVGIRYARIFYDENGSEIYTELSPMSPISSDIVLNQQTLVVTISNSIIVEADPQVNQIWIYIFGGFMDTYYRVAVISSELRSGMTIDDLTTPAGSDFNTAAKRTRLTSPGFTSSTTAGSGDIILAMRKSESDAMIENVKYEPGCVGPPDNIIGIAGPWNGRMFVLTSDGWLYPSTQKSPSAFSLYHCVDLRKYGTPYWLAMVSGNVYAGFSKDIIRVEGTGDEDENHITADIYGTPLDLGSPPVDVSITWDRNILVYRSADGLMTFSGTSVVPTPKVGTMLLWRGVDRHGVSALNTLTGEFELETDKHDIYMLAPEGDDTDPTSLWRFDNENQQWYRFTYTDPLLSLCREPSGHLIAGTSNGKILEIETGSNDDGSPIPVTLWTAVDAGENPLARKAAVDFQFHGNTGGNVATLALHIDSDTTLTTSKAISLSGAGVFRSTLDDLGKFLRVQGRLTGSFTTFIMQLFSISYRPLPQQVMELDTGYLIPPNNGRFAWLGEVEIDCVSPNDLYLDIYKDDVLYTTLDVPIRPNVRSVYRNIMPHGVKARRVRLVYRTTNEDGSGNIGFEPYSVKIRHAGTGDVTELPYGQGDSGNL